MFVDNINQFKIHEHSPNLYDTHFHKILIWQPTFQSHSNQIIFTPLLFATKQRVVEQQLGYDFNKIAFFLSHLINTCTCICQRKI
jgi:hypothetical protein